MERDDIIRMAREADAYAIEKLPYGKYQPDRPDVRDLHFAALVAAHERKACALVVENCCSYCAERIRERGEEPKRHPGYIIGDHWLQAAYTRICTGETEDEVMTDYGWQRESR